MHAVLQQKDAGTAAVPPAGIPAGRHGVRGTSPAVGGRKREGRANGGEQRGAAASEGIVKWNSVAGLQKGQTGRAREAEEELVPKKF
jgi:hypothetical protein